MTFPRIVKLITYNFIDYPEFKLSLRDILLLILALTIASLALKVIQKIITKKLPNDDTKRFVSIFQIIKYFVYLFVMMFTLKATGVNMDVFLTASAALFVGLGFALQTFFQDIISGILIILDQSLHVGDIIEVDNKVGKVTKIKLRTTIVVTRNERVMVIPNHKFMAETLFNWTQNSTKNREQVTVGVAYGSNVRLVEQLLNQSVHNVEGVLMEEPIIVTFDDFGDSALIFSIHFFVDNGMKGPGVKSKVRFIINDLFAENNISIPFPQRDLHIISSPKH